MTETFSERLVRLRKARCYSQRFLASRCGITHASIVRLENGEHKPRFDSLAPMARALGVTTDYLLTGTDPNSALRRAILIGTRPEILLAMARREL